MSKWQRADLPLDGSLNLAADPQAMPKGDFCRLENVVWADGALLKPRWGHKRLNVRDASLTFTPPASYTQWVYGEGYIDPTLPQQGVNWAATGPIQGLAARDSELLAWDGWRTLSYNGDVWTRHGEGDARVDGVPVSDPTIICHAEERSVVGLLDTAQRTDVAQGLYKTLYTWREGADVFCTVEDNETKAAPYRRVKLYTADPEYVRCAYSRKSDQTHGYFFVVVSDNAATAIRVIVIPEADPQAGFATSSSYLEVSATATAPHPFDIRPAHEGKIGILFEQGGNLRYVVANSAKQAEIGVDLSIAGAGIIALSPVALAIHPDTTVMATWTWNDAGTKKVITGFYSYNGTLRYYAPVYMNSGVALTTEFRVACEFDYLKNAAGEYRGTVAWTDSNNNQTTVRQVAGAATSGSVNRLGDTILTHQANRVGDVVFFTTGYVKSSTVQPMIVNVSGDRIGITSKPRLYPVAANLRGVANIGTADKMCQSVSYVPEADELHPNCVNCFKWTYVATGSRLVLTPAGTTRKDYQIVKVDLNYLPTLRSAQAGRSLYVAGGVVQEFDGASFLPAGFLQFPEPTISASGAAGSMTASSTYTYRIYLEERNASGEWIRSAAITKSAALAVGQTSMGITLPALPFVFREKWRFSIYRGAANSTLLKLVTQVTPTYSTARYTATNLNDAASDASIASNALDPSPATTQSGFGLLDMMAPPPCTLIAAGKERMWFAGGAISNGAVAYSRLFDPGEVALWNEALLVQVDRTDKPITGMGFMQDAVVVFKEDREFMVTGPGPDNLGRGDFNSSFPVISDVGCIAEDSIATTPVGVVFQSKQGVRLVTPGGGIMNIGHPVDPAFDETVKRLVSVNESTVRFHGPEDTYVLDYSDPEKLRWCKWTYGASSVTPWKTTVVVVPAPHMDDYVWVETRDEATDGGNGFGVAVDLGWQKVDTNAGWGRVKWCGLVGKYLSTHKVHWTMKYNYRDLVVDDWTWIPGFGSVGPGSTPLRVDTQDYATDIEDTAWETSTTAVFYPGGPYLGVRSFTRQRCASFRLAFEAVDVRVEDDPEAEIKSERGGFSLSGLTVAFIPSTENGRFRKYNRQSSVS